MQASGQVGPGRGGCGLGGREEMPGSPGVAAALAAGQPLGDEVTPSSALSSPGRLRAVARK